MISYNFSNNKMLSEAGKIYSKTKVVNPYNTARRFKYYQLDPVPPPRSPPKPYQTLDSNLRDKNNSYLLRYNKDIVTNTDHSPSYHTIDHSPRRPIF